MTDNEGLSVREAVDWCSGGLTVREITRLLRLDGSYQGARDEHVGWAPGRAGRRPVLGCLLGRSPARRTCL